MTGNAEVMRYFLSTRDRAQSDAWVDRTEAHFERTGFGIWAVEAPEVAPFIGFVGLSTVPDDMAFAPAVEFVWTLDAPFWRRGYTTEAARAVRDDGFGRLGLREIVAFTASLNTPSRGVMAGLGMTHNPEEDFDHPRLPAGHMLARHVLYRLRAPG
jgi:ribosomal-protein-alanine N-acetyltransferase